MNQIDRKTFFDGYRTAFGALSQLQVDGLNYILGQMEADEQLVDVRHAAYMLATVTRETGATYQPVSENLNYSADALLQTWPSRFTPETAAEYAHQPERIANFVYANRNGNGNEASGEGWRFRGRGFVQITGKGNYKAFSQLLGIDLATQPDLAKDPAHAYGIMSIGMRKGLFTGQKLSLYIHDSACDYVHARKIINGLDHADEIAGYAKAFERILTDAAVINGKA